MSKTEIKIAGFGGQGVILAGGILGKAAAIYDDKYATLTHSYGPEARGGACSAQIIINDDKIGYPYVIRPDVLALMSQEAAEKYVHEIKDDGFIIYEKDLVRLDEKYADKAWGIHGMRIAEELGNRIVLNMVMLGFTTAVSGLISARAMRKAIKDTVPGGTEFMNETAFNRGLKYGRRIVKKVKGK